MASASAVANAFCAAAAVSSAAVASAAAAAAAASSATFASLASASAASSSARAADAAFDICSSCSFFTSDKLILNDSTLLGTMPGCVATSQRVSPSGGLGKSM